MNALRLLKAALIGFAGLFIIVTLFSLLIPSRVMVSRSVLINNTSASEVFEQTARFNNWVNWHPVFTMDSATITCKTDPNKNNKCCILHRSKSSCLSLQAADTTVIKFLLKDYAGTVTENELLITTVDSSLAQQVEWRAISHLHWYPWQKFYGIFIDRLSGPGYDAALNGLKNYLEIK